MIPARLTGIPNPMRSLLFRFLLAATLCTTVLARDEQRISQLREGVKSLEAVMADSNSPSADRLRLQKKLDSLKQELGILEERQAIEQRDRQRKATVQGQTREHLRELLQTVSSSPALVESRQKQLEVNRAKATEEREALLKLRAETTGNMTEARRAELDEQYYTKNEEIRAISLQQDAADYEVILIQLAKKLREQLLNEEGTVTRLTIHSWTEKKSELKGYLESGQQLAAKIIFLGNNLEVARAGLDSARQKMANIDDELQMLERQVGFLRRNAALDQLLTTQRAQKQFIGLRLPFLGDQTEALRRSQDLLKTQQELVEQEVKSLTEQLAVMQAAYVDHLLPPATAVAVILLAYLLSSRLVLSHRYKKEELFMARRLGRYATFLLITGIVVLYTIEDLRVIAATLGLVSAAIVISLQDVCVSFFGWSVIMVSRKFIIGDRLEIEGVRGDVLDIQLLRTTLLEVNNWLGVDQPTGRVVIVPNSFVFKSKVFNFSHGHPYIWGKVEVTITYSTPVADATELFQKVLEEETRENFAEAQRASSMMQERYGVEDAEYLPKIYTRIADSGITFSLLYVSHYRATSSTRNRINLRLIREVEQNKHIQLAYNTLAILSATDVADKPSAIYSSRPPFLTRPAG